MLSTKSILAPKEISDGLRISVMSRHTLNDGVTSHPLIDSLSYDLWMPIFAPPARLLGDYYKRGLPWEQFEIQYIGYMQKPEVQIKVEELARLSLEMAITLLCIEDSPKNCHRRVLAEDCRRYQPKLALRIR